MMKRGTKFCIGLFSLVVILLITLPFAAQWYLEKNSNAWTGRQIRMQRLRLNYFTGGVTFDKLIIQEANSDTIFFFADRLYLNAEPWHALFGSYNLLEVTIDQPNLRVTQVGEKFNFDDLIDRFATAESDKTGSTEQVRYRIENISLRNGTVAYLNNNLGNNVVVRELDASIPLVDSDTPDQQYRMSMKIDKGGDVDCILDLNSRSLKYMLHYKMEKFNLDLLFPYLRDYINVAEMKGTINAKVKIYGNFNEPQAIAASGSTSLDEFSITDEQGEPMIRIGSFAIDLDTLNVKSDLYDFKSVTLNKPYLKFERFENQNNFSRLLDYSTGTDGTVDSSAVSVEEGNILELIASYVQELSQNYAVSNYKADSVVVNEGTLVFNDYTLHRKFNYLLEDLRIKAEQINSHNQHLTFLVSSRLNTSGKMKGELQVDPNGFRNMIINYSVEELRMADFNPYSDYYIAHPFLDGVCFYTNSSRIDDRFLLSENNLEIRQIRVGKKEKNNTAVNLPLRFAVALLRDVNGNINLAVPMKGNLDDPKYRIGPIIWQILKNLVLKAVAAPGKLLAKRSGVDEKYIEGFDWKVLQDSLDSEQIKCLDAVAKILGSATDMNVELIGEYNIARELDQLAVDQSKRRFLFFSKRIASDEAVTAEEQARINSLETRDSLFNAYVDQELQTGNSLLSIVDKSKRLVGHEKLKLQLSKLYDARNEAIRHYLVEAKNLSPERLRMTSPKETKDYSYETLSRSRINFYLADEDAADSTRSQ